MIKVAALTSGRNLPSTRFRVRQYIEALKQYGIVVDEYIPAIEKGRKIPFLPTSIKPRYVPPLYLAWIGVKAGTRLPGLIGSFTHQITWLQRELIPGLYTLERFLKSPIIYDVDDAIWTTSMLGESTNSSIAKRAKIILAGNTYIANWFSQYSQNIHIIPTAIDSTAFVPVTKKTSDKFIVGWSGSYGNLPYIEQIEPVLKRFVDQYKDSIIRIICDKPPKFHLLSTDQFEFIPWSPEIEISKVQTMDVGLMPLDDNDFTRGKCSFKMLQYMSCAIPVIVSPVGMNADVLKIDNVGVGPQTNNEWFEALELYYKNRAIAHETGINGRKVIIENFSQSLIAQKLANIFQQLK